MAKQTDRVDADRLQELFKLEMVGSDPKPRNEAERKALERFRQERQHFGPNVVQFPFDS